jgi:hypothetical protein
MASSGMDASEIISLSINDFIKSLEDYIQLPSESIVSVDVLVDIIEKRKKEELIISNLAYNTNKKRNALCYIQFS